METSYKKFNNGKLLLKLGKETIGMLWLKDMDQPSPYISHVHIYQAYRNEGYGSKMLTDTIKRILLLKKEAVSLHVGISNSGAIRFYRKHGFFIACTTTEPGYDALTDKTERHYLMVKKTANFEL